jgi:predicted RNA-binding Zn-ribbon protein involved in translation (DUF1610 family)
VCFHVEAVIVARLHLSFAPPQCGKVALLRQNGKH